jgi:hypothetical protein
MKKRYQIDQQRAVQEFRQLAREENPNLQMIFPMTEVVGLLQEGVGHLMREAGLALMSLVMEEEVRHLAGERHEQHPARRATAGEKKLGTAWWTDRRCRSKERVCARRKIASSGWAVTSCSSAVGRWSTRCGTS